MPSLHLSDSLFILCYHLFILKSSLHSLITFLRLSDTLFILWYSYLPLSYSLLILLYPFSLSHILSSFSDTLSSPLISSSFSDTLSPSHILSSFSDTLSSSLRSSILLKYSLHKKIISSFWDSLSISKIFYSYSETFFILEFSLHFPLTRRNKALCSYILYPRLA